MTALTYAEAQERARLIDVSGYRVDLDLTGGDEVFGSVTVVRFGCRAPGASTFADVRPARLRRVVLNGQDLDPGTLTGNRLPLPRLQARNELRVEADMAYSRTGAGLHRFTDDADGQTYLAVHGGLDDAQRVFASFDQPDMKAVITATVRAPAHWTVVGNGLARPTRPGRWELAATPPMSTYLSLSSRALFTASAPRIATSRSACTPGNRWPGSCAATPRRSSPSPGPVSTGTPRSSPSPIPMTPTTRHSSPSLKPGRWRIPAA